MGNGQWTIPMFDSIWISMQYQMKDHHKQRVSEGFYTKMVNSFKPFTTFAELSYYTYFILFQLSSFTVLLFTLTTISHRLFLLQISMYLPFENPKIRIPFSNSPTQSLQLSYQLSNDVRSVFAMRRSIYTPNKTEINK